MISNRHSCRANNYKNTERQFSLSLVRNGLYISGLESSYMCLNHSELSLYCAHCLPCCPIPQEGVLELSVHLLEPAEVRAAVGVQHCCVTWHRQAAAEGQGRRGLLCWLWQHLFPRTQDRQLGTGAHSSPSQAPSAT